MKANHFGSFVERKDGRSDTNNAIGEPTKERVGGESGSGHTPNSSGQLGLDL